jgi:hypothetical protein
MGGGSGGELNPDWVERLMGYPDGWTDIERGEVNRKTAYPAAWIDGTWENGMPRTATGVKHRRERLKCLGNSIVPQIAARLFARIKSVTENAEGGGKDAARAVINALNEGGYTLTELTAISGKSFAATRVLLDTLSFKYPIYEDRKRYAMLKID